MAVMSGVALIKGGWVATGLQLEKKTPRGIPSCRHMLNKSPHQSQTTTEDEANMYEKIWVHAVPLKSSRGPLPSVLAFQCFVWPRKSQVEK